MSAMGGKRTLASKPDLLSSHPKPFLGDCEHFLKARIVPDQIEIRVDVQMAEVHRAFQLLEEGLESFYGFVHRADVLNERASKIVAHHEIVRIQEECPPDPL